MWHAGFIQKALLFKKIVSGDFSDEKLCFRSFYSPEYQKMLVIEGNLGSAKITQAQTFLFTFFTRIPKLNCVFCELLANFATRTRSSFFLLFLSVWSFRTIFHILKDFSRGHTPNDASIQCTVWPLKWIGSIKAHKSEEQVTKMT